MISFRPSFRKVGNADTRSNQSLDIQLCLIRQYDVFLYAIINGYIIGCPPVRGDNPRALASGLSYVQVDKHGILILYQLYQCRICTSRDISLLRGSFFMFVESGGIFTNIEFTVP